MITENPAAAVREIPATALKDAVKINKNKSSVKRYLFRKFLDYTMSNKYIYGPVPSRRLGRSLGVDLVPYKVCSYDCIYCQLGRTTRKTIQRREYNDSSLVLSEVKAFLKRNVEFDYLTLAGSGEPTLNAKIGEIISSVKSVTNVPVLVLSNGSMLWDEDVRYALKDADVIVPSMDAVSDDVFRVINRPDENLEITAVLDGLIEFSKSFSGEVYLEILFVKGVNDAKSEIEKMKGIIEKADIDKVHLNTVVRPPCERDAVLLDRAEMDEIKELLGTAVPVEVISDYSGHRVYYNETTEAEILSLLRRRPCRLIDLSSALGVHQNELIKYLTELKRKEIIAYHSVDDSYNDYYTVC